MADRVRSVRCAVVGDNGVGKSTLIQSYINEKFTENLEERIHFKRKENIDNCDILLCITDMPIAEKIRSELYVGIDICLLCYDITNEKSLKNIETKWVKEVMDYCPRRPYLLVGTRCDLYNDLEESEIATHENEGIKMAQKISASNHIICSSRKMDQVAKVFKMVIRTALIDAHSNRKHEKGLSWLTPVEYVGSFINESFRMAKCAVPLLKQTAVNFRESWRNPNAFVEAKHNLLYFAPFLTPCVPVNRETGRRPYWHDFETRKTQRLVDEHKEKTINIVKTSDSSDSDDLWEDTTQAE
uniref:Rho-related GTP-binding protein RhoQ n=1 Tax=Ascaris suum TaxID=6253 RepID=F1LAI2_ASCSU